MSEISQESRFELFKNAFRNHQITIQDVLGDGGQGIVYRGMFEDKPAALKIYEPSAHVTRVKREVDKLRKIRSEYVVELFEHGQLTVEGLPHQFVAFSLIDGDPLDRIKKKQSDESVRRLLHNVLSAIDAFWSLRLVHRDIKPANVIRASDGRFVVIDLGLAKHLDQTTITQYGYTCGTSGYMSPEQMKGRRSLTYRSDLFALGILAYQFAANRHPFLGLQQLVDTQAPVDLSSISSVSEATSSFIHRLLNPNPLKRATVSPLNLIDELNQG